MVEGSEPQGRHEPRWTEGFAIREAEGGARQPCTDHERCQMAQTSKRRRPARPQQQATGDEKRTVADITEHHSEHHDVGETGERGGVHVPVIDGGVGVDQWLERSRRTLVHNQRGRVSSTRRR